MKKLFILPFFLLSFVQAETIPCYVVGVTDGDTITCLVDQKEQVKVRLYQIDTPESGQAYGQKAKQALSDLIFNKFVDIETHGQDRYKRTLGTIRYSPCGQPHIDCSRRIVVATEVNLYMIKQGYAWYYPFTKNNPEYQQAEQEARQAKRGLWADKNPIPPWEWRKSKKDLKEIDLCVNFPTKQNPDGCSPRKK